MPHRRHCPVPSSSSPGVALALLAALALPRAADATPPTFRATTTATITAGNRIGSYAATPLEYDAAGNLTRDHRGRTLAYDWKNRLTAVTDGDTTVSYRYGPHDRKLSRTVSAGGTSTTELYAYDAWQLIGIVAADGVTPVLQVQHGRAIDEPVRLQIGNGPAYRAIQDQSGSVTHLVDDAGRVVEAYTYRPHGRFRRHGPERLDHIRVEAGRLALRFTAEMNFAAAMADELVHLAPAVAGTWTASDDDMELTFAPGPAGWPTGPIQVTVEPTLRSLPGIAIAAGAAASFDGPNPNDAVLVDDVTPAVRILGQDQVTVLVEGQEELRARIQIVFSEPMQASTVTAVTLHQGGVAIPLATELSDDRQALTLVARQSTAAGLEHRLTLGSEARDLGGNRVAPQEWTWQLSPTPLLIDDAEERAYDPDPPSLVGNRLFFQGRERDPDTGLYDFRNRWYSAELGRWLTRDPAGYPDGPNPYAAFAGNPQLSDPLGLGTGVAEVTALSLAEREALVQLANRLMTTAGPRVAAGLGGGAVAGGTVLTGGFFLSGRGMVPQTSMAFGVHPGASPWVGPLANHGELYRTGSPDFARLRNLHNLYLTDPSAAYRLAEQYYGSLWVPRVGVGNKARPDPSRDLEEELAPVAGGASQRPPSWCDANSPVVPYRPASPGMENHHGVLDVWATHNIEEYRSRASDSPTVVLTPEQHAATKAAYRDWLEERTGRRVGGRVDWKSITAREALDLSERMFDAADVADDVRSSYYAAFHRYVYCTTPR